MMRELTLAEGKLIWDKFVPKKQLWTDDWDLRVAICKEYGYIPLILYDGKNFFPLQYEPEHGFYSLLSGVTAEKNYLTFDPEFMKTTTEIPKNIYFDFLIDKFDGCIEGVCPQFFIDLTNIQSIDDYIKRFSKKHRKNFKNACNNFGVYRFIKHGTLSDLEILNKKMFGTQSDFETENRACYVILDNDERTEYWSIIKDGKIALISQYFFYNDTMAVCVWGVDENYTDTLKIALGEAIKLAKSRGCTTIDYAPTYSSWKFLYRLDTAPLWRYIRGTVPEVAEMTASGIPAAERAKLKTEGRL